MTWWIRTHEHHETVLVECKKCTSDESNPLIAHLQLHCHCLNCNPWKYSPLKALLYTGCQPHPYQTCKRGPTSGCQTLLMEFQWLIYLESIVNTIRIAKGFKEVWGFMKFTTFLCYCLVGLVLGPTPPSQRTRHWNHLKTRGLEGVPFQGDAKACCCTPKPAK